MLYKEAVSKRVLELLEENNITVNHFAETSPIPSRTLYDLVDGKATNPSSYVIYLICKRLEIQLKVFYDSELFNYDNITD